MHVDVLMTWKANILAGRGIVTKCEKPQLNVPNSGLTTFNPTSLIYQNFVGSGFKNDGSGKYVLTVVG